MLRIVVQERRRLVREAIAGVLSRTSDVEVVAAVPAVGLHEACRIHRPDVVIVDLDDPGVAIEELGVQAAEAGCPRTVVALHALRPDRLVVPPALVVHSVADDQGISGIVGAARDVALAPPPPPTLLSGRELEILRLIAAGRRSAEMGSDLGISPQTVEEHKRRIFAKLDVRNQSHAVARAIQLGLFGPTEG